MNENEKWYSVAFRILSDTIEPDKISSILGLQSTFEGKKGELYGGKPGRARYDVNLWGYSLEVDDSIPFEEQIPKLLDVIEKRNESYRRLMSTSETYGELVLGYSSQNGQGGAYLPSELLKRITNLELDIIINLYPPTDDDS
jgi:Domain of unknown function (DUF4279)